MTPPCHTCPFCRARLVLPTGSPTILGLKAIFGGLLGGSTNAATAERQHVGGLQQLGKKHQVLLLGSMASPSSHWIRLGFRG